MKLRFYKNSEANFRWEYEDDLPFVRPLASVFFLIYLGLFLFGTLAGVGGRIKTGISIGLIAATTSGFLVRGGRLFLFTRCSLAVLCFFPTLCKTFYVIAELKCWQCAVRTYFWPPLPRIWLA